MHGPGPVTPTNPLGWQPTYTQPITVLDDVEALLPRRRTWRWARDRALDNWREGGLDFVLEVGAGAKYYPVLRPWEGGNAYQYMRPNTVRLLMDNTPGKPSFGFYSPFAAMLPGAVAVFSPQTLSGAWLKWYMRRSQMGHIGHEVGHTLGLWHRADAGIMSGSYRPDAHDLDSLRGYYT